MILHYIQLFFIYSLLGFIWETLWVSITEKKLAKRGFLKGPILPIYGFGALIILISVHPYTDNPFMIYFAGMTAATILELITGYLMEKLLHVRYWDYDERPLNFHGYICARSSLFWGLISIILVKQINPGVEDYLNNFSFPFLNHMTIVLIMVFILDLSLSLKEAIDLRNLIHYGEKLSEYSEQLLEEIHEKSVDKKEELLQIFEQSSAAQAIEDLEILKEKRAIRFENAFLEFLENREDREKNIKNKAISILDNIDDLDTKDKLQTLVENIYKRRAIRILKFKKSALRIMRRNKISYRKRS
ncbi:MAG: putative ABC transporter permease [Andreesenia angusta]|nr:putative ABC transporter permease [Andreesenia angusta]